MKFQFPMRLKLNTFYITVFNYLHTENCYGLENAN